MEAFTSPSAHAAEAHAWPLLLAAQAASRALWSVSKRSRLP